MSYRAPVDDIMMALKCVSGRPGHGGDGGGLDADTVRSILAEAGRFAGDVLDPLNRIGDKAGCSLSGGAVTTPPGWGEAYHRFAEAGWPSLPCPEAYGGQDLPADVASAVGEIWNSANLAFGLLPLLTQGAIDAIAIGGSPELKAAYLPRLVSGEWSGTMNLTEPQAGSDLSGITTRAVPQPDGTYRLFGTKIFITYGEHDIVPNIIHLVLARLPDAPAGTRGISLFLVPKVLVAADGSLGRHNDVVCAGIEHKLGIHGSPTCVMTFGETEGATGYLVGEANRGLNTMFIMMNAARLAVGVQGVAIAERATQRARLYAAERRQGRRTGAVAAAGDGPVAIAEHPDVRRMLIEMRAKTMAARLICLATAAASAAAHQGSSAEARAAADARAALLTPVAKAHATDVGCEVASLGVQVHGGMGFVEETGAAQYYRDARILPIYEGTNGIQALDLVTRKLPLAGGAVVADHIADMLAMIGAAREPRQDGHFGRVVDRAGAALHALDVATRFMGGALATRPEQAMAGASAYLRLFAIATASAYLVHGARVESEAGGQTGVMASLARFYGEQVAGEALVLADVVVQGAGAVLDAPASVVAP
ncbi:MAG: acyl-CoA dehydrogenase [Hyphomicrobiaceae bacterium]|nr:acyl-CoA dehydrogenase [Hyphomicrobiaceae bacterium]